MISVDNVTINRSIVKEAFDVDANELSTRLKQTVYHSNHKFIESLHILVLYSNIQYSQVLVLKSMISKVLRFARTVNSGEAGHKFIFL